jgi:hypoxanthine phosphoribosyltransferase
MKAPFLVLVIFMSLLNSLKSEEDVKSKDVSPFDYSLEKVVSQDQIVSQIRQFATLIQQDYQGEEICILAILKGALWFATDLMKELRMPVCLQTISCSSYGQNGTISGDLTISGLEKLNLKGKHVLVVDDVCDTGKTLFNVIEGLKKLEPKSLKSMVLVSKSNRGPEDYQPDYVLFDLGKRFIVGYGLDYKEYYRGLPDIYVLGYHD